MALAASVFLFLALVTGAVALFAPGRARLRTPEGRIRALRPERGPAEAPRGAAARRRERSTLPGLQGSWAESTALDLRRANLQLRVGEYLIARAALAVAAFFVVVLVSRLHPIGLVIALVAAVVGFLAPAFYVRFLRQRRVTQIEKQLVELLPMLASSLRAGFAFQQAVELAAQQLSPPLVDELSLLLQDVNLGATMDAALQDLGERVGSPDLDMVITAIQIQRLTGGNLSEVLDQVAETLRERERIRGDIDTLTAQQKLTGLILSLYPMGIGGLLLLIMPDVWTLLFTETAGWFLIGIALGLQALGFFAMRRIVNIDI